MACMRIAKKPTKKATSRCEQQECKRVPDERSHMHATVRWGPENLLAFSLFQQNCD